MVPTKRKNRKLKPKEEKIDRISSLPDSLIHHILSFLPSTKFVVQTCVLSKRWQYQWTHVPVLIFNFEISDDHFSNFVDGALILYDSPTITKFVIEIHYSNPGKHYAIATSTSLDPLLPVWLCFAIRKHAKETSLVFGYDDNKYSLPQFFFKNDSLIKLNTIGLDFSLCRQVNWSSLKVLQVSDCDGFDEAIAKIISGSPSLESFEFGGCNLFVPIIVVSKSLKRLVVGVSSGDMGESALEICCPNLEYLEFTYTLIFESYKVETLPSSACVTFDLYEFHLDYLEEDLEEFTDNLVQQILQPLKHVEVLNIGHCFLLVFSVWVVVRSLSSPLMNTKCLTLNISNFDICLPGVVCLLRNSPVLDKLIINFEYDSKDFEAKEFLDAYDFGEKYWNSEEDIFNSMELTVKKIEIGAFWRCKDEDDGLFLRFLESLLKNCSTFEELAIFGQDMTRFRGCRCRREFELEDFNKLLSVQRCCPHAIVSLSCCKANALARKRVTSSALVK